MWLFRSVILILISVRKNLYFLDSVLFLLALSTQSPLVRTYQWEYCAHLEIQDQGSKENSCQELNWSKSAESYFSNKQLVLYDLTQQNNTIWLLLVTKTFFWGEYSVTMWGFENKSTEGGSVFCVCERWHMIGAVLWADTVEILGHFLVFNLWTCGIVL